MISLKRFLPRGLFGRAALILIVPIVTIQLVVSTAFIQRHFEGVTRQMSESIAIELNYILGQMSDRGQADAALEHARAVAGPLQIGLHVLADGAEPIADEKAFYDVSGAAIISTLRAQVPQVRAIDVTDSDRIVRLRVASPQGDLLVEIPRRRMSATNPHQLLVLMAFTSVLMTLVAYGFLRNQLRPIATLARAAEAFGRGERMIYRPRGALEVRAAGRAFVDMRQRLERQIEQRMLMLSGVSHDLRTPLTRLKLALSFLPDDEETRAMQADVVQMERLTDEFLNFVRGDATEVEELCDMLDLMSEILADARRGGGDVSLLPVKGQPRQVQLRPQAIRRAIENLVNNGLRHGRKVQMTLIYGAASIVVVVEDDGPGIPENRREEAMRPFTRLSVERDPNRGGGVGLGLSISTDVALSHGGSLRLGAGRALPGLRAELSIAR